MAAEAGELLLRVGAPLPILEERALTKKETRYYKTADAMYSEKTGKVTFNKPRLQDVHKFYGSYKNYEESLVKDGWLSQPNMFLHELGHYLDHYFGKEQPDNRIGDLFSRLDEKKVEADVSGYAATSKAEFMAELYSGILSGKVYSEEYLKAANLDYYTKVEIAQRLLSMASGEVPNTTALQQQWGDMIHAVYTEGGASFKIELLANPEVEKFIDTHARVLDNTFALTEMSDVMRERLQNSDWIFSGMKTFHELNEAFPSLLDENGHRKSFEQFLNDVQKIDDTYNRNYLNAEYNFAQASAEMAGKWESFRKDDDYLLQYRTQQDGKVRPEHATLHGVTLPADDSFWDEYYPPNGWNCRCTVAQVRKEKYAQTDHDEAMRRAEVAIPDEKTRQMFGFNPGKEQRAFPAYNPYTISKCTNCPQSELKLAAGIPANQLCEACAFLQRCVVKREVTENCGKGTISVNNGVNPNDSDYHKLYSIAQFFANNGSEVHLTPKMSRPNKFKYECVYSSLVGTKYEGKCPDLLIDGKWYEHEGFVTTNPKNAFRNMLRDGLRQSNRIIVDRPELSIRYMTHCLYNRVKNGEDLEEVWLRNHDGSLELLYKKTDG